MHAIRTLLLASAAAMLGAAPSAAQMPITNQVTGDSVALYALVGDVRVEAAPAGVVEIRTIFRGDAGDAYVESERGRAAVVYPAARIVAPGVDRAREYTVARDGTFGSGIEDGRRVTLAPAGEGMQARAELVVSLPPGKRLVVHLAQGRIAVPGAQPLTARGPVITAVITNTGGTLRMRPLPAASARR